LRRDVPALLGLAGLRYATPQEYVAAMVEVFRDTEYDAALCEPMARRLLGVTE
jgi:hypothetical protein